VFASLALPPLRYPRKDGGRIVLMLLYCCLNTFGTVFWNGYVIDLVVRSY